MLQSFMPSYALFPCMCIFHYTQDFSPHSCQSPEGFCKHKIPKGIHRHAGAPKANTHLPPAFAGALTLVSGPEAEAAGTAMRVGVVKIEGTFPTGIAPDTSYVSLQTWQP